MEQLLSKLYEIQTKICSLKSICKQNHLNFSILNGFSTKKIKDIYSRLLKHYNQHPQKAKYLWFQSQLKLFNWILISYCFINQKTIEEFTLQDWACFKPIFYQKDINTFRYEAKKILYQNTKKNIKWISEEEQILITIMEDDEMKNKWNEVGRKFFEISQQKYYRTAKQCRQHWLNHLDPSKQHGKWTSEEDLIILKFVLENGKKWSLASKKIAPQRTQHMIKNRFKSLIGKFQKRRGYETCDQNLITKKIIAIYERNSYIEADILKQNLDRSLQKEPSPGLINQQKQPVYIEKQNAGEPNDQIEIKEVKSENYASAFKKIEYFECQNYQNINLTSQYYMVPFTTGLLFPAFPGFIDFYNYWSQIN